MLMQTLMLSELKITDWLKKLRIYLQYTDVKLQIVDVIQMPIVLWLRRYT